MSLDSYDLKSKLFEKTFTFLQRHDKQTYSVLRQHCLELTPLNDVLVDLNSELQTIYKLNTQHRKEAFIIEACANQITLDRVEAVNDNGIFETKTRCLNDYKLELNGNFLLTSLEQKKLNKQLQTQEKQRQIQNIVTQLHSFERSDRAIAESSQSGSPSLALSTDPQYQSLQSQKTFMQRELLILNQELATFSERDGTLRNEIHNCEQSILQCQARQINREKRQAARSAPSDHNLLQLSETSRSDLNKQIQTENDRLGRKLSSLLSEGTQLSFSVFLQALENRLELRCPAEQEALRSIIENVRDHCAIRHAEAATQKQLQTATQKLEALQISCADRKLEVIIASNKLGISNTNDLPLIDARLLEQYHSLIAQNKDHQTKLTSTLIYTGLSFALSMGLGISAFFVTALLGPLSPIAFGVTALLFFGIGTLKIRNYRQTTSLIQSNQIEADSYFKSHENITATIPQLNQTIAQLEGQIHTLQGNIVGCQLQAEHYLAVAYSIQIDEKAQRSLLETLIPSATPIRQSTSRDGLFYFDPSIPVVTAHIVQDDTRNEYR